MFQISLALPPCSHLPAPLSLLFLLSSLPPLNKCFVSLSVSRPRTPIDRHPQPHYFGSWLARKQSLISTWNQSALSLYLNSLLTLGPNSRGGGGGKKGEGRGGGKRKAGGTGEEGRRWGGSSIFTRYLVR